MHIFRISILCLFGGLLRAQTVTPTVISNGGGFTQTPSGSIAWTFAEPVSATYVGTTNITTMGFHQTEVTLGTLINEQKDEGSLIVFPNPVYDELKLKFGGLPEGEYNLKIHDAAGRLVYIGAVAVNASSPDALIRVSHFAAGAYFLSIKGQGLEKAIKINKVN